MPKEMYDDFDKDGNLIPLPDPNRDLKLRVGEMVCLKKNPIVWGRITEIRWDMVIGVKLNEKPFTWMINQVERVDPLAEFFD